MFGFEYVLFCRGGDDWRSRSSCSPWRSSRAWLLTRDLVKTSQRSLTRDLVEPSRIFLRTRFAMLAR